MRTNLLRCALAFVALLTLPAAPVLAQGGVVRGRVVDASNKPVEGATITFENKNTNAKQETKTDKKGEFLQVGLTTGAWTVTANKEGVGSDSMPAQVSQGRPTDLTLHVAPGGNKAAAGGSAEAKAAAAALQASAQAAGAALQAGRNDEAIEKYNEIIAKVPTCADCYTNIGTAYANKQQWAEAETAYKKSIELKPDNAEPYNRLASVYNSTRKFDLAAEASNKAKQLNASSGGGGSAEASYNQGVILFNGAKFAEAKAEFEAATKADPTYAPAFYQLGMTSLNLGQIPDAVAALEKYLQLDPNGARAAEVKASLPALQGMLKK
jgi:tetratricopeptide (TPR) repeat protein